MIFTREFTFIHIPKNAGSFVETILRKIYAPSNFCSTSVDLFLSRYFLSRIINRKPYCYWSVMPQFLCKGFAEILTHGWASEAPLRFKSKPFLAVMRDPLDRYISEFEFQWWQWSGAIHPNAALIKRKYPDWPHITSFSDDVYLRNEYHTLFQQGVPLENRVGIQTETFIRFFCKNPHQLLSFGAPRLTIQQVIEDLFEIHFLNMDFLNIEFSAYLAANGVEKKFAKMVESHEKVLPHAKGRSLHKNYEKYYSAQLMEYVLHVEDICIKIWKLISSGCRTTYDLRRAIK
jgi:hypothetical protein